MRRRLDISWDENGLTGNGVSKLKVTPLVHAILGPRPVVLVGSRSKEGIDNLAIFNTLNPLGTNPPLYSLLIRPLDRVRDTFSNILDGGKWTCNAIPPEMMDRAHASAEHFPSDISEFESLGIEKENKVGIREPFVQDSPVQMWMQFLRKLEIPENGTHLLIGRLRGLWIDEHWVKEGALDWDSYRALSSWGLSGYSLANDIRQVQNDVDHRSKS